MKQETRFPILDVVIGVTFLLIALRCTLEFKEQSSVTIFRVGIPAAENAGLLAIFVICTNCVLGGWLFVVGVRRWLAKRKVSSALRDDRRS